MDASSPVLCSVLHYMVRRTHHVLSLSKDTAAAFLVASGAYPTCPLAGKLQTVPHGSALAFCKHFCYYDQYINRIHVQGTSFALSRVEGNPIRPSALSRSTLCSGPKGSRPCRAYTSRSSGCSLSLAPLTLSFDIHRKAHHANTKGNRKRSHAE